MSIRTRLLPLFAALFALVCLACFAVPLYVIRPFRHQGSTELSVALFVTRIAPWLSILCAVVCFAFVVLTWSRARAWSSRAVAVCALLVAIAGAYVSHINIYERMFHHLDAPQFARADHVRLEPDDMVIAVRIDGVRRAYPIREIAYHHVVNDTVGGEPIVATY